MEDLADASGIAPLPNVMRHSFGSYFLAFSGNENLTANEMGNTPAIVHRNYKELVTKQEAARYFRILPPVTAPRAAGHRGKTESSQPAE